MCHVAEKIKNLKNIHVEVTRGDSVSCCATRGYHRESLVCKGESQKKNITGGIPKHSYFVGG
jgi:hypothetical protein